MTGVQFTLDDTELEGALSALRNTVGNIQPALAEMGEAVLSQAQDSFQDQTAPDGTPWKPSQRALMQGGMTLIDKGQLLGSLSMEVLPDSVMVGTTRVDAAIHQFGGKAGRGLSVEIPARPYMPDAITVDMEELWDILDRHFGEALN